MTDKPSAYCVFNMGFGMILFVSPSDSAQVQQTFSELLEESRAPGDHHAPAASELGR